MNESEREQGEETLLADEDSSEDEGDRLLHGAMREEDIAYYPPWYN